MIHTSDCDKCSNVKSCSVSDKVLHNCRMFRELDTMQTPLILHLLMDERKVQSAFDVLNKFDIRFQELSYYPYFKLTLR